MMNDFVIISTKMYQSIAAGKRCKNELHDWQYELRIKKKAAFLRQPSANNLCFTYLPIHFLKSVTFSRLTNASLSTAGFS
jgi:hypothetical protein